MQASDKASAAAEPGAQTPERGLSGSEERDPAMVDPNVPEVIGRFEPDSDVDSDSSASVKATKVPPENLTQDTTMNTTQRESRTLLPPAQDYTQQSNTLPSDEPADPTEWRTYILDRNRQVPITKLCWDHDAQFGQIRPLKPNGIKYYVQRLMAGGEPVRPVDTFVKIQPGVVLTNDE